MTKEHLKATLIQAVENLASTHAYYVLTKNSNCSSKTIDSALLESQEADKEFLAIVEEIFEGDLC